jgi:hypothetical protein
MRKIAPPVATFPVRADAHGPHSSELASASGSTWGYFFSNPSQSGAGASSLNRPCDYAVTGETLCRLHAADLAE